MLAGKWAIWGTIKEMVHTQMDRATESLKGVRASAEDALEEGTTCATEYHVSFMIPRTWVFSNGEWGVWYHKYLYKCEIYRPNTRECCGLACAEDALEEGTARACIVRVLLHWTRIKDRRNTSDHDHTTTRLQVPPGTLQGVYCFKSRDSRSNSHILSITEPQNPKS